jgi:hypothetical protein
VNGAGTALTDAATVLGPDKIEIIAKHPKKRCVAGNVHRTRLTVYLEVEFRHEESAIEGRRFGQLGH